MGMMWYTGERQYWVLYNSGRQSLSDAIPISRKIKSSYTRDAILFSDTEEII